MDSQGFYVYQTALGAPLEFHPALGTAELDEMVDAYVVGVAAIQDKRAAVSLDFFNHAALTGESVKYYSVAGISPASATSATSSPASMHDSGYASSFSVSPIAPTWTWGQASSVPAVAYQSTKSLSQPRRHQASSRRTSQTTTPARHTSTDFSHLPGMKILTKDGRDVTNAASRGCKTKEQRDHAHLMRIIKACDSCKKKKVRCDPSHKTRDASRATKARAQVIPKLAAPRPLPEMSPSAPMQNLWSSDFSLAQVPPDFPDLDGYDVADQTAWEHPAQLHSVMPDEYDWLNDPNQLFSPVSGASSTPASQPFTPPPPQSQLVSPPAGEDGLVSTDTESLQPTLPYLASTGPPHNYVDFNLFSPAKSFSDEEPPVFAGDLLGKWDTSALQHKSPGEGMTGLGDDEYPGDDPSVSRSLSLSAFPECRPGQEVTRAVPSPHQSIPASLPTSLATSSSPDALRSKKVPPQQAPPALPSSPGMVLPTMVQANTAASVPTDFPDGSEVGHGVDTAADRNQSRSWPDLVERREATIASATWNHPTYPACRIDESSSSQSSFSAAANIHPPGSDSDGSVSRRVVDSGLNLVPYASQEHTCQPFAGLLQATDEHILRQTSAALHDRHVTSNLQVLAAATLCWRQREKAAQAATGSVVLQAILLSLVAIITGAIMWQGVLSTASWLSMLVKWHSLPGLDLVFWAGVCGMSPVAFFGHGGQDEDENGRLAMPWAVSWNKVMGVLGTGARRLPCQIQKSNGLGRTIGVEVSSTLLTS